MFRVFLALHIISIISWMAGILYLLRLFVYHRSETEAVVKNRFETMESRLYRYITVPAMLASIGFGTAMLGLQPRLLGEAWLLTKLALAAGLVGVTLYCRFLMDALKEERCPLSERTLRLLNEVPTLLMIAIVFLVILRPF